MFALPLLAFVILLPFVASQDSPGLQLAGIEANFNQSHLVPDLLSNFNPTALLSLNYAGVGDITPGQALTEEQVAPTPTVTVTPASSAALNGTYTLVMVDAEVVGSDLSQGVTRHWLLNGVTLAGTSVSNSSAVGITIYAGPAPASGSGPHRYVIALYTQPPTFVAPSAFSQPNMGVSVFDFNQYLLDSKMGPLVAATYFSVEAGTATASQIQTSPVISSTLSAVAIATSGSVGTTTGTKSSTATTSATTQNAANILSFSPLAIFMAGLVVAAA